MATFFRTIDFRPAPAGWRVLVLDTTGVLAERAMPGWLIQEAVSTDEDGGIWHDHPEDRVRIITAAISADEGALHPARSLMDFWCVLGPDDPVPTADDAMAEVTRRKARDKRLAAASMSN